MAISRNNRGYGAGKYGVEFQHTFAGWVKEVEGGAYTAEIVNEKMGGDPLARKHLGPLKYEEITVKCGAGMSQGLYEWIQSGFNQQSNARGREGGAVIYADYDDCEISRLNWTDAMLSEFTMPALDASSKDPCLMTIKFQPETTDRTFGAGGRVTQPVDAAKQKRWLPSNFKIEIPGLEEACKWVNKVEALTIKQKVVENAVGEKRDYERIAVSVEVPNLVLTLSESHAKQFYDWYRDFVKMGNCSQENEKHGTLTYLPPNLSEKDYLFKLDFFNLGIFKMSLDKGEAGAEGVRRVKVEMYCEELKFNFNSAYCFGKR